MIRAEQRALALAAFQMGDLVVTQVSARFGDAHLDHLGVPPRLRPVLPIVKAAAAAAFVASARRPRWRSVVGAVMVSYYAAAATFHVLSHDRADAVPAIACAGVSASLV